MPLRIELALIVFLFLLLLDDTKEFIALSLGLRSHNDLPLDELLSATLVKLDRIFAIQCGLCFLVLACFTLSHFESSLGSKAIDFALTISCTLLKLS